MTNQIFLNGAPIVGFGDPPKAGAVSDAGTRIGGVGGVIVGAGIGALVGKGVGALIGAVVGGVGGAWAGSAMAVRAVASAWTWRDAQFSDIVNLKVGQQYAAAVAAPNGAPFPPDQAAEVTAQLAALATAPVNLPMGHFATYPPGAQLPPDWPTDDNLGPNAYRATATMLADFPQGVTPPVLPPPSVAIFKLWIRG